LLSQHTQRVHMANPYSKSASAFDSLQSELVRQYEQGGESAVLRYLDARLTADPTDAAAYYCRAYAQYCAGDMDSAFKDVGKSIEFDVGNAAAYLFRAQILYASGSPVLALADCESAICLSPDYAVAHLFRGHINMELGRLDVAFDCFSAVIELSPSASLLADAHARRDALRLSLGDRAGAEEDLEASLLASPNGVKSGSVREMLERVWSGGFGGGKSGGRLSFRVVMLAVAVWGGMYLCLLAGVYLYYRYWR